MPIDRYDFWFVVIGLGLGSYGLRFLFLGLIGNRPMPERVMRHLRYTPVAVLPALVAPQVAWPAATDGAFDVPRVAAAAVTILLGMLLRNTIAAILGGAATLYTLLWLLG